MHIIVTIIANSMAVSTTELAGILSQKVGSNIYILPHFANIKGRNTTCFCISLNKRVGTIYFQNMQSTPTITQQRGIQHDMRNGSSLIYLKPVQNGRHFAEDIFKLIFLKENIWFFD